MKYKLLNTIIILNSFAHSGWHSSCVKPDTWLTLSHVTLNIINLVYYLYSVSNSLLIVHFLYQISFQLWQFQVNLAKIYIVDSLSTTLHSWVKKLSLLLAISKVVNKTCDSNTELFSIVSQRVWAKQELRMK